MNSIDTLVVQADAVFLGVVEAKQLPSDKRKRRHILQSISSNELIKHFVVVERFDAAGAEEISFDSESWGTSLAGTGHRDSLVATPEFGPEPAADFKLDIARDIAAAAAGVSLLGAGGNRGSKRFVHAATGCKATAVTYESGPEVKGAMRLIHSFDIHLTRLQPDADALLAFAQHHAYLQSPAVQIKLPDSPTILGSVLPASAMVFVPQGKTFLVAVKADSLATLKKKRVLQPADLMTSTACGQIRLLIKHLAASFHVAQSTIQLYIMFPALSAEANADFIATEWMPHLGTSGELSATLSPEGKIALAEFAALPGSVVQTYARVLPGVPTRIGHIGERGYEVIEILSLPQAVQQRVNVRAISLGKVFF
jgi:hypothetical protein